MFFSVLVVLAYVLSACSGAPAGQSSNDQSSQSGQVQEVVFTGTVDAMGGGEWTISGQAVTVDGATSVEASVMVGSNVKVEARVDQAGKVTAISIELAGADNANANSNDANQNDDTANDNAASNSDNGNGNDNSNSNSNNNDNSSAGDEQEVSGVVEAITTESITINGVVYMLAEFTEFKGLVALGDSVKIHVIVNADGTFTIREIEKTGGPGLDNGNSNSNDNGSDDNSNGNVSNGNDNNSNDDNSNDNSNDNGNDDNSNDDNGNDDNSNSNGNG